MEGAGARLGRSASRYGPAAVFSGPVRKWKKSWVPGAAHPTNGDGAGYARLLLFRWTPVPSPAFPTDGAGAGKDAADAAAAAEPHRRKFRYVPVSVIEEQKLVDAAETDDETKTSDADASLFPTQSTALSDKPDATDTLKVEAQASIENQDAQQKANETNLDLSLGLKAHDVERKADQRWVDWSEDGALMGRPGSCRDSEVKRSVNSESENRRKRKVATPDLKICNTGSPVIDNI